MYDLQGPRGGLLLQSTASGGCGVGHDRTDDGLVEMDFQVERHTSGSEQGVHSSQLTRRLLADILKMFFPGKSRVKGDAEVLARGRPLDVIAVEGQLGQRGLFPCSACPREECGSSLGCVEGHSPVLVLFRQLVEGGLQVSGDDCVVVGLAEDRGVVGVECHLRPWELGGHVAREDVEQERRQDGSLWHSSSNLVVC